MPSAPLRTSYPFTQSKFFWDGAIAAVLACCIAMLFWGTAHASSVAGSVATVIGAIGFALTAYGSFVEPQRVKLNNKSIHHANLPPLRIVVAADFHVGMYRGKISVARAVDAIIRAGPDLILLPGDFVDNCDADLSDLDPLSALPAVAPCYAVIGNHDAGRFETWSGKPYRMRDASGELKEKLEKMGMTVLRNAHATMMIGENRIVVAGIDDLSMESSDIGKALEGIDPSHPVILLSHNPDVILDEQSKRARLIVSGHTHGGQIRLPLLGPLAPIPDELGRRYDKGIFHLAGGTVLAVTSGLGETGVRARLFCAPEILLLDVRPAGIAGSARHGR